MRRRTFSAERGVQLQMRQPRSKRCGSAAPVGGRPGSVPSATRLQRSAHLRIHGRGTRKPLLQSAVVDVQLRAERAPVASLRDALQRLLCLRQAPAVQPGLAAPRVHPRRY
jgi:hypothetical protein